MSAPDMYRHIPMGLTRASLIVATNSDDGSGSPDATDDQGRGWSSLRTHMIVRGVLASVALPIPAIQAFRVGVVWFGVFLLLCTAAWAFIARRLLLRR